MVAIARRAQSRARERLYCEAPARSESHPRSCHLLKSWAVMRTCAALEDNPRRTYQTLSNLCRKPRRQKSNLVRSCETQHGYRSRVSSRFPYLQRRRKSHTQKKNTRSLSVTAHPPPAYHRQRWMNPLSKGHQKHRRAKSTLKTRGHHCHCNPICRGLTSQDRTSTVLFAPYTTQAGTTTKSVSFLFDAPLSTSQNLAEQA